MLNVSRLATAAEVRSGGKRSLNEAEDINMDALSLLCIFFALLKVVIPDRSLIWVCMHADGWLCELSSCQNSYACVC